MESALSYDELHDGHGTVLGTLGDWVKISPKVQFNYTPNRLKYQLKCQGTVKKCALYCLYTLHSCSILDANLMEREKQRARGAAGWRYDAHECRLRLSQPGPLAFSLFPMSAQISLGNVTAHSRVQD